MPTLRVDGNDIFAVFAATKRAREIIVKEKRPVLIEGMTYRVGDHSSSDFSDAYRTPDKKAMYNDFLKQIGNPITRLEKYMISKGLIDSTH